MSEESSKPGLPSKFIAVDLGFDVRVEVAVTFLAGASSSVFLARVVVVLVVAVVDLFNSDVVRVAAEVIDDKGNLEVSVADTASTDEGTASLNVTEDADLQGLA
jgi:hypothetical protein